MPDQEQRVALVTGGTSGIGLAVTRLLAAQGHRVFLCARNADDVAATVKQLRDEGLDVDGRSATSGPPRRSAGSCGPRWTATARSTYW